MLFLEREAATELIGSGTARPEGLPDSSRRLSEGATDGRAVPGQVRDVEDIEHLEEALYLKTFTDFERLREPHILGPEVIAKLELRWQCDRSDGCTLAITAL